MDQIIVYTDGGCSNNGKSYAKAGYGIYFGENDIRNVSKRVIGKQSNNTGELTALIETYKILENEIKDNKNVIIYTDSIYAKRCCGEYGLKCYMNDYKNKKGNDIPNANLVKIAYELYKDKDNIKIIHVKGHTGEKDGNYYADKLANLAIGKDITKDLKNNKIYINVPYERKDEAKSFGAKWDYKKKKWYIFENKNKDKLLELFK